MVALPATERKFLNAPLPKRGPDVPYKNDRKENPAVRGLNLVFSAILLEWLGFVRSIIWQNTGFSSLRKIQEHIEYYEPRYDPTVVPVSKPAVSEDAASVPLNGSPRALSQSSAGYYSAADYHALYISGELTPTAVALAILPLIRKDISPPGEHSIAWFETNVDLILKAAEASTLRYKEKCPLGVLDGVPTAIKDEYDVEGYTTCLGSVNNYTGRVPEGESITSWCVKKLLEAGTINFGKLHMHEFGLDTSGNNPIYGTPPNPHNPKYYTGGSSSGCAYAVSAGLVPISLGGDGGGSIRIPASFCSVFGLKPSHNRLSFAPAMNHSTSCAVNGPLASDMNSLTLMYRVLAAPDANSPFPSPEPLLALATPPRNKALGICEEWVARATPRIQALYQVFVKEMVSKHGYKTVSIKIPFLPEGQTAHAMTVLTDASTLLPVTKNLTPANKILLALGRVTPATDYLLAQKLRKLQMQHLKWLWEEHPGMIILTPTTACEGWKIGGKADLKYGVSDGVKTLQTMEFVWMANFLGTPAISIPLGFVPEQKGEGKVPVGVMGMGEWGDEEELLGFGVDAERLAGGADVGMGGGVRPKGWVDVIQRAREVMESS